MEVKTGFVGLYVGSFFAVGRFLGALGPFVCVSWLLVGVLGRFFDVRDRSGLHFGRFWGAPGQVLDVSRPIFRGFFAHALLQALALHNNRACAQNYNFSCVFLMILIYPSVARKLTRQRQIA